MISLDFIRRGAKVATALGVAATIAITALIQPWEGLERKPYRDVGGVWTVCYGHTGSDIVKDKVYSNEECHELLMSDVIPTAKAVDTYVKVPISHETRAALISFTYNVGINAFKNSTLLRKLNAGDTVGACDQLMRWVYVKGRYVKGLENRRIAERQLCLKGATQKI
jgi:lysozyme